jgi:hypothetical protein
VRKRGFVVGRLWAIEGARTQRAAQLPMYSPNASNEFPSYQLRLESPGELLRVNCSKITRWNFSSSEA